MVKKSKSFISCLLAVLMILTAVPLAFAEENDPLNYSYSSDYTYVTVTGCNSDVSGEVVVLAEHDGKPVKTIATQAFAYCNKIETVIISEGIETIEACAFAECSSLKKVYVPKSVTEIHVAAFKSNIMPFAKNLNVTVCGYPGSVAETFAKENGLSFKNACNHTETEIKNAVEATCKKEGYTGDKVCKECGETVEAGKKIEKKSHTYDEGKVTTPATCKTKGVKTFTCTGCGATKTEDVAVDPNAHTYDEGKITTPATCKTKGEKTFTCTGCGATKTEVVPVDPDAHTYDEGKVTTPATCKTKGEKTFTCTGCGATKTEVVAVDSTAHTPAPAVKENEVAATCTVKGSYDLVVYCTECETEISRETKTINPDPKNHVNGYIIVGEKTATCKEKGYTGDYCCVDCDKTLEEGKETPIDRFNHTGETETRNAKEATCTKDGYSGDTYCLGCGVRLERGKTIIAFGHKDENKDGRCDTCGAEYYTHETCPCRCHKSGFDKFLFKLALFFQMLFDKNRICKCGDIHY